MLSVYRKYLLPGFVLALAFERARLGRHYDYRTFVGALLGRGWVAFEVLYVLQVVLAIGVDRGLTEGRVRDIQSPECPTTPP